ncbi:hypothetical protein [Mucilaginibacter flavus]|uniref:hypothetical protein n=1 Tax=Mucilaginibacter flavus TaxID=931504 RepID=UPI0025B2EBD1|nr:hypothetical protein [Mucilaginibacter flavus]MDN3582094.1 hypothetical protein [Mucilaginibacter flavus]
MSAGQPLFRYLHLCWQKLKSFRQKYSVGAAKAASEPRPETENEDTRLMQELIRNGHRYTVAEIGTMLDKEQKGMKRPGILILLQELYKSLVTEGIEP